MGQQVRKQDTPRAQAVGKIRGWRCHIPRRSWQTHGLDIRFARRVMSRTAPGFLAGESSEATTPLCLLATTSSSSRCVDSVPRAAIGANVHAECFGVPRIVLADLATLGGAPEKYTAQVAWRGALFCGLWAIPFDYHVASWLFSRSRQPPKFGYTSDPLRGMRQDITMRRTRVTAAAVAAMLGAAAGGCALLGGPPTPSPNNPMNTGRVPSARKLAPDNDSEVRRADRRWRDLLSEPV